VKSIFKSTAILSVGSVATILVGLVSAKVAATLLHPAGYGYYGLLQGFVGITSLLAGFGISTGLVRLGASAAQNGDEATIGNLRRAAWFLFLVLGILTVAVLLFFSRTLSTWALGTPEYASTIRLLSLPLLFTAAASIQTGTLNAYHYVGSLAKQSVVSAILGYACAICCVILWRQNGIVPAVICVAGAALIVSTYYVLRETPRPTSAVTPPGQITAIRSLLKFGTPFTASALVGTGMQFVMPALVLHLLNTESVGYYRAAFAISVNYLGFLITAMAQDYYPRVSAVRDQPVALASLINEQHRLVMTFAAPGILGTLALVPYLVPLVYSSKFMPTVEILEWQLIGDLFKFSSWTMAYVILAHCSGLTYFLTELLGGLVGIVTLIPAVRWFGLPGLGISFVVTYIIYFLAVWLIVRRDVPLKFTVINKMLLIGTVLAACIIRILPSTRFAALRTPVALLLTAGAAAISLRTIWRELSGHKPSKTLPGTTGSAETAYGLD
jgi:antigen flippase